MLIVSLLPLLSSGHNWHNSPQLELNLCLLPARYRTGQKIICRDYEWIKLRKNLSVSKNLFINRIQLYSLVSIGYHPKWCVQERPILAALLMQITSLNNRYWDVPLRQKWNVHKLKKFQMSTHFCWEINDLEEFAI